MNDRTKAALIGGLIAGVLSGLPVISGCCFLWAIAGGFVTVWMYMKNAPTPMALGDAAKLGAMAGVIGAVISIILGVPFMMLGIGSAALNNPDMERAGIGAGVLAVGGIFGLILRAACVIGFAAVGGIIGSAVLGKGSAGAPPPPPPPGYGGPTGGTGYTGPASPTGGGSDFGGPTAGGGSGGAGGFGTGS
ncbi:MAG: hypothetical protein LC754_19420 [Acidobacteria bacterium]|nr:hypothetical protein [Acidobacteriota bacterium]